MKKSLIERLKENKIPPVLKKIAKKEDVPLETLVKEIIRGRIVFLKNEIHDIKNPCCIGKDLYPKINVNVGTSTDETQIKDELEKVKLSMKLGADTVMDLSVGGNLKIIRKKILDIADIPVGTVPMYEIAVYGERRYKDFTKVKEEEFISILEEQACEGVDFFTIHACITKESLKILHKSKRLLPIVSRGGALMAKWITHTQKENPFYKYFEKVIQICKKYNVVISLGDSLRPGALQDSLDSAHLTELLIAGELVKKCREKGAQVMVEGPGHVPLHQIESCVILEKKICDEAPFYVLGPLVLDIAPGYDHIGSAIGGAIALWKGADFYCVVTPAEHLRHPTLEDIKEGIISAKIASHASFIARRKKISQRDIEISKARGRRDWKLQEKLSLDREKFKEYRESSKPKEIDVCTMCGKYCSLRIAESCKIRKRA